MSAHVQRAQILLETGRPADAEKEARAGLSIDPENRDLLRVLCLALVEQEKLVEANDVTDALVALAPDWPESYLMQANVYVQQDKYALAHDAAREALSLSPDDVRAHRMLGWIYASQNNWNEALAAAEAGLALDPEDSGCGNLRAMVLSKLGRRIESEHETASALRRDPMNTYTQSTAGWVKLERGETDSSLEHFGEALRLDPMNEHARMGLVEGLKARNPVYRALLNYSFWMMRLPRGIRIGIMLGGYFGYRFLVTLCSTTPSLIPVAAGLTFLWLSFVVFIWTGYDLFNLILLFDRQGRHALSARQRYGALALAACLVGAAAWTTMAVVSGQQEWVWALAILFFAFPLTRMFRERTGWRQVAGYVITAGLGILLIAGLVLVTLTGNAFVIVVALIGLVAYTWLGFILDR